MTPKHSVARKRIFSLIPRLAKKLAWARWRNNPPVVLEISKEDATKALLMNKYLAHWWKESGGHKKVWNKIKDL